MTFKFNVGIKVHDERQARERANKKKGLESDGQSDSQKLEELRCPLAYIRKILRMPSPSRTEAKTGQY